MKKKSGENWMCVDCHRLNKITVRDNFNLPLIEDCLEYLDYGNRWVTGKSKTRSKYIGLKLKNGLVPGIWQNILVF